MVTIAGEPWYVAADVCECLDLRPAPSNGSYQNHYKRFAPDELSLTTIPQPNGHSIRMKLVSESGLYKLVMRSDKPGAKEFQNWVTKVVLPAIRKDGGYVQGEEHVASGAMTKDELMARAVLMASKKIERLSAENAAHELTIAAQGAEIDTHLANMTVGKFREYLGLYWSQSLNTRLAVAAKKYCVENNLPYTHQTRTVETARGERETKVNVLPRAAWDHAARQLGIIEA